MNDSSGLQIRRMGEHDMYGSAEVHRAAFPRQILSLEWIRCNHAAFPRMQYFVAERRGEIIGYILWVQKSGFRTNAVLELEQIAVHPLHQGKGIGELLITSSLPEVKRHLAEREAQIKNIIVTTRTDNMAQRLYEKTLGATCEAVIRDLYSADEAIMVARLP